MSRAANGEMTGGPDRRHALLRVALAGLSPKVIAIVAALLLLRCLSVSTTGFLYAISQHQFGDWLDDLCAGYVALIVMATPMLLVVIATANLGPRRGPKRIAALAAAVIVSAGVGTLLRIVFRQRFG